MLEADMQTWISIDTDDRLDSVARLDVAPVRLREMVILGDLSEKGIVRVESDKEYKTHPCSVARINVDLRRTSGHHTETELRCAAINKERINGQRN